MQQPIDHVRRADGLTQRHKFRYRMISIPNQFLQNARDQRSRLAQIQSQAPCKSTLRQIPDSRQQQLPFLAWQ